MKKRTKASLYLLIALSMSVALLNIPVMVTSQETKMSDQMTRIAGNDHLSTQTEWSAQMGQFIQSLIQEISKKDVLFQEWENSDFHIQPVGPGSKQWLVILTKEEKEIGYLVIGADQNDQLVLIEYGQGLEHFFSSARQQSTAVIYSKDGQPIQYNGLFIGYEHDHGVRNFLTDEQYEHVQPEEVQPFWSGKAVTQLVAAEVVTPLAADPIVYYGNKYKSVTELQSNESYMYVAELIPRVTGLYAVHGWHQWEVQDSYTPTEADQVNGMYIGIQDEGCLRFFSSAYLQKLGTLQLVN